MTLHLKAVVSVCHTVKPSESVCHHLKAAVSVCHRLLVKMMDLVSLWPAPLRQRLVSECAQWSSDQIQRLIIAVEQHLTIMYFENDNRIDASTHQAVKFLSIVSEANDQSKAVPYTRFYLDIINSEDFDVKRDYVSWKRPGLLTDSDFSFCQYPFVYDPATKSDILSFENTGEMREQFHDAIFESFFTGGSCPYLVLRVSLLLCCFCSRAEEDLKVLQAELAAMCLLALCHGIHCMLCKDREQIMHNILMLTHQQEDSREVLMSRTCQDVSQQQGLLHAGAA